MNHVQIPKDPDSSVQLRPLVDFRLSVVSIVEKAIKDSRPIRRQKEINDLLMGPWSPGER